MQNFLQMRKFYFSDPQLDGGITLQGVSERDEADARAGSANSDTGIGGFRAGHPRDRRKEIHEEAQT